MITLENISKKIGGRLLFENISASFLEGCRYGLTGPNGSGKSTLLKIMMKEVPPTSGTVSLPAKVGFLRQDIEAFADCRVIDTVIMGNRRLWQTLEEKEKLYQAEITDEIGLRLGHLEEIIAEEEGYTAENEAEELLFGMGVEAQLHLKKIKEIPADQQFRVLLCQALFGHPQALLLDEPTNHLDLSSIGWLESFLKNYPGILIVVSHDRHFLNSVCTQIADIDYETIIIYPGDYDNMVMTKTKVRERTEAENKSKEKKVSQLKEFVSRFGAGTRASQVQSRLKEIQRLQPQDLKKSNIERPYIRILPPEKASGKTVLKASGLSHQYHKATSALKENPEPDQAKAQKAGQEPFVFQNLSFEIHAHDKIA
ncbi:MAG: ATP-binding cassette domain-containing protein [Parachlamydiales bacterium]|jgi:ATPase subunit of ABC transporter with duplicated ATPase domains